MECPQPSAWLAKINGTQAEAGYSACKNSAEENLKIVITDYRFPDVEQERRAVEAAGGTLVTGQAVNEEQVAELCRDADGVLKVRAPITRRAISAMERCRIIVRYGIGVDTVDVAAATERGILRGQCSGLLPRRSFRPRAHAAAYAQPPDDSRDCAGQGRHLGRRENAAVAAIARTDLRPRRLREDRLAAGRKSIRAGNERDRSRSVFERAARARNGRGTRLARRLARARGFYFAARAAQRNARTIFSAKRPSPK